MADGPGGSARWDKGVAALDSWDGEGVMKFKSPIQMGGVSIADDLRRCLV
jgi:hypothetical protein